MTQQKDLCLDNIDKIEEYLKEFGLQDANPAKVPITKNILLKIEIASLPRNLPPR